MSILRTATIVTAIAILTAAHVAQARDPQSLGRCLGIGWSDGYHAPCECPPKGVAICKTPASCLPVQKRMVVKAEPLPWWKIPASETQRGVVVHESSHPSPAAGPSLFRQAGE
jgi:hypothetical protein